MISILLMYTILAVLAPIWYHGLLLYEIAYRLRYRKFWFEPFCTGALLLLGYIFVFWAFQFWGLVIALYIASIVMAKTAQNGDYALIDSFDDSNSDGQGSSPRSPRKRSELFSLLFGLAIYPICFIPHLIDGYETMSWTMFFRLGLWLALNVVGGFVLQSLGFTSWLGGTTLWGYGSAYIYLIVSAYTWRFFPDRPRKVYRDGKFITI